VSLTLEGQDFLARCQAIVSQVVEAEASVSSRSERLAGRLRISLPVAARLLGSLLAEFSLQHPGIELDLDYSDHLIDIVEEGYDVVLRSGDVPDTRLKSKVVGAYEFTLVASSAYLARFGTPVSPTDLVNHRCLRYRFPHSGRLDQWIFCDGYAGHVPVIPATIAANAIGPLIALTESGAGIAYIPAFAVQDGIASGRLCQVLPEFVGGGGSFRLLWPAGRHETPTLRAFVSFMARNLPAYMAGSSQWPRIA